MNTDIRLMLSFQSHPKTKKLRLKLGNDAVLSFIWLMMFAAANKPDGILDGMDEEDIALAADWSGDPGEFVEVLVAVRYLEWHDQDTLRIHDWEDNNPWAAGADARSERAKKAADARWGKTDEKGNNQRLKAKNNATSMHKQCESHADSNAKTKISNAPSPSPSPIPSPLPSPPISNKGGKPNVSSREEEKSPPPNLKIEREKRDYSDFEPEESTVGRLKMDCRGITDAFIRDCINEFVTYAETHYRPDQLQSKFLASVRSDFKRQELNGHQKRADAKLKVPSDPNLVMDWAKKNGHPIPEVGESMEQYKQRVEAGLVERRREAYV